MRCTILLLTLAIVGASSLQAQGSCFVVGSGSARDRALAEESCGGAAARFEELFERAAPAALIDIVDTLRIYGVHPSEDYWLIHWGASSRLIDIYADPGLVAEAWSRRLPHELGHLMMFHLAEELGLQPAPGAYASPFPDWLDEGVATWVEPENRSEAGTIRRERPVTPTVREIVEAKQPHMAGDDWVRSLGRTVTMPCLNRGPCTRARWNEWMIVTRRFESRAAVADTTYAEHYQERGQVLADYFNFYSNALLRFIHERGGSAAVVQTLERLAEGAAPLDAIVGAPGIPASAEALERDWSTWFTGRHLRQGP